MTWTGEDRVKRTSDWRLIRFVSVGQMVQYLNLNMCYYNGVCWLCSGRHGDRAYMDYHQADAGLYS